MTFEYRRPRVAMLLAGTRLAVEAMCFVLCACQPLSTPAAPDPGAREVDGPCRPRGDVGPGVPHQASDRRFDTRELLRVLRPLDAETGVSLASAGDVDGDGQPDLWLGIGPAGRAHPGGLLVLSGRSGKLLHRLRLPATSPEFAFGAAVESIRDLDGDGTSDVVAAAWLPGSGSQPAALRLRLLSGREGCVLREVEVPGGEPTELLEWPWRSQMIQLLPLPLAGAERSLALAVIRGGDREASGELGSMFVLDMEHETVARRLPIPEADEGLAASFVAAAALPVGGEHVQMLVVAFRPQVNGWRISGGSGLEAIEVESGRHLWSGSIGSIVTALATVPGPDAGHPPRVAAALLQVEGTTFGSTVAVLSGQTGECLLETERGAEVLVRDLVCTTPTTAPTHSWLYWIEEAPAEKELDSWERRLCRWDAVNTTPACVALDLHPRPSARTLLSSQEPIGAGQADDEEVVIVGGWWAGPEDPVAVGALTAWHPQDGRQLWVKDWEEMRTAPSSILEPCGATANSSPSKATRALGRRCHGR